MKLLKESLGNINTIAHDGKVLLFGTDQQGIVWYTVKQSGFEDSVFSDTSDAADGFEAWKKLPLGESTYDASTEKKFSTLLLPVFGKDQAGNENSQAVKSAAVPVQLVSGMGHLHVFRQSIDNKLLVNRFVLDGMKNELMPKLDVRFKRSRQKYEVSENMKLERDAEGNAALKNVDAPDFKDMDGNPFYEPTWKLDFIGNLHQGWFSAVLLPTVENGKYRWSIFAYDSVAARVVLYTVRASHSGIFDLKDYYFVQPQGEGSKNKAMRTIHGIIKRTLNIKIDDKNLIPSNGQAATAYNVQKERIGDDGEAQFLKDATRVMLAVPVKEEGAGASANAQTAVISFAVGNDGTLSQVDETPETELLSAKVNELILPLNTLDEVKELAETIPSPSGVVTGIQKSSADTVTVLSRNLPETLKVGENVDISGTKNYNGLHKVVSVTDEEDGTRSFEIAATFNNSEAGFWESVPKTQTGLTFDNMVVSYRKAGDSRLKVTCSTHKLSIGDEVQVTGTREYDGPYPIKAIDEINDNFTIDMDYQPGEAVDLKAKKRRGIRFGGGSDYLRTGNLKLDNFGTDANSGRTMSAWLWLESEKSYAQLLVGQEDHGMELWVNADNKVQLSVHLSDNALHTVTDPEALPMKRWVHYTGTVEYKSGTSKATHLSLCKNGVKVTPTAAADETVLNREKVIGNCYPSTEPRDAFTFGGTKLQQLPDNQTTEITYSDSYSQTVPFNRLVRFDEHFEEFHMEEDVYLGIRFTQEFWILPTPTDDDDYLLMGNNGSIAFRSPTIYIVDFTKIQAGYSSGQGIWTEFTTDSVLRTNAWNHVATTFDGRYYKIYVNGEEKKSMDVHSVYSSAIITWDPKNLSVSEIGSEGFIGYLQEVRMWNKARSGAEILRDMNRRFSGPDLPKDGLVAYYQFDKVNGSILPDQSGNKLHGLADDTPVTSSVIPLELSQRERREETIITPGEKVSVPKQVAVEIPRVAPVHALSLAFWVKTNSSTNADLVNYSPNYSVAGTVFTISTREFSVTNPGDIQIYVGNDVVDTNVTVSDGEWHHLAVSWESENGVLAVHKDGEECFRRVNFRQGHQLSQATTAAFILGSYGNTHFVGSLGQFSLWSKVLSVVEVKRLMENPLTGEESNLVGAWVYGRNQAFDLSPQCKHGKLYDNPGVENIAKLANKTHPIRLLIGGAGSEVGSFTGKLSEVRVWNAAQTENTVKDRMYIPLGGLEEGLAGNWRMGAIVIDKGQKQVPDFSTHSNNATVHGMPFVSERCFNRKNGANKKIVEYSNDELVAVATRARYRESFEFRIQGGDGNAWTLDKLNDADGSANGDKGVKVFQFAYWGKASRSSEKTISFPTELYSQDEFTAVTGASGWFRASCEFMVPDGVSLVRLFHVQNVEGLWGSETTPPATEWTEMEVRKHQIVQISDAITHKAYVDNITVQPPEDTASDSGSLYDLLEKIRGLELCEADLSRHLRNLLSRLDIAENLPKYVKKKNDVRYQREKLITEQNNLKERKKTMDHRRKLITEQNNLKDRTRTFTPFNAAAIAVIGILTKSMLRTNLEENEHEAELRRIKLEEIEQEYSEVTTRLGQLLEMIKSLSARYEYLHFYTTRCERVSDIERWKTTTKEGLQRVHGDLNVATRNFLSSLSASQQQPQSMDQVALDRNKLVTQGTLLTSVSPKSRLHAFESFRGNVELNYFDPLGKLQCTSFDATADSRNSTFEQWLPNSLRPAVEFRDINDKMYFDDGRTVSMTTQWTLETWFQYPLVAQASGAAYEVQVLIADARGRQIAVQAGRYLGAQAGGAFFETGIDLEVAVAQGWHHLAVTLDKDKGMVFFLDGKKYGATAKKYALTFRGDNIADYVKWSNFSTFPTTAFTVELWIKTLGRNTNPTPLSYGTTSNSDIFVIFGVNPVTIYLGDSSKTTDVRLDDGFWHHLAVTWNSATGGLNVYKDGDLVHHDLSGFKQDYTIGSGGTLVLGQEQDSLGGGFELPQAFQGSLRELSIWNAERGSDDIRKDMYTTFKGDEANLVGYWCMDTIKDSGKLKLKDHHTTGPQHGEICGAPEIELVSVINESAYEITTIGNAADGDSPFGRLAEMRLWSVSLSEAEIEAHAQANNLTGDEPGLVAYYPMNEGKGTIVRDHSGGTKIDAELSGADWKACTAEMNKPGSVKPKVSVLDFDGSNDYVEIPGLSNQLGGNEITVEYWFKGSKNQSGVRQNALPSDTSNTSCIVVSGLGTLHEHLVSVEDALDQCPVGDSQNNHWHHVAMTWKKGATDGFVSYLDGEEVAKRNASNKALAALNGSVFLGCINGVAAFIEGQMAEVRIWKKARTKEQIIANMHRRLTGKETGLKACYPLDSFVEVSGVIKVRDITPNNNHGSVNGANLVTTEDLLITGVVDRPKALYFDGSGDLVDCGPIDLVNKTFSIESWVKNSRPETFNFFVTLGTLGSETTTGKGLHIGFRSNNNLTFAFGAADTNSTTAYNDRNWHHVACTYNHTSHMQTLYRDGKKVGENTVSTHFTGIGNLYLGSGSTFKPGNTYFKGSLDDIRVWNCALSPEDIVTRKDQRLSGKEPGLIRYWQTGNLVEGKLKDRSTVGSHDGTITGAKLVEASDGLPFNTVVTDIATASISACEYATMGRAIEKPALKTSMLRSFRAISIILGDVEVLFDQRIEDLQIKWVGNAQFKPTILGFIEGAPPVPSENLTVDYDYNNATSVTLRESKDVSYTWNRTKDTSHGLDLDLFAGAGWGVTGGLGIETKITEGRAGFKGSLNTRFVDSNSSNVVSGSTLSFNDTLALRGEQERGTKFSHLGKRFVPKNVGYALVVSGVADIFISRLARSGRMISYEMRPVEGVPLDINTITFQINPTYIMNGSLDGLTGSSATSDRFFRHVPEMRSQYGSLYPASYYRIKEAYALKEKIERWDKDREAYFWNFDVSWRPGVDPGRQIADFSEEGSYGQVSVKREEDKASRDDEDGKTAEQKQNEKIDKLEGDMEKEKDKAKAKADKRQDEIEKRFGDPEARERASSALSNWQSKMENLLIRAGKRNIVNTYVWDANGGMRVESQDFANTVEHTIGSNFTIGGTLGGLVDAQIAAFQLDLTALYAGELAQTSSKTENIGKTFGLDVDVYGVESKEVMNLDGKPLKPGEKVGRYRFMSFYLGGNTDNFHDFFDYVVDPEWLAGNSEGARALRQAKAGKPNKAWRVLHRVTYVERPSLEGVGVDTRQVSSEDQITDRAVSYFDSLAKQDRATKAQLADIRADLTDMRADMQAQRADLATVLAALQNNASTV